MDSSITAKQAAKATSKVALSLDSQLPRQSVGGNALEW